MLDGRLRWLAVGCVLVVAGACSDGGSDTVAPAATTSTPTSASVTTTPGATTSTSGVPAASTTSTVPTTGSTAVAGDVTVRGSVLAVFASARVLQLDPPVNGYSRVALTSETEYRLADGSAGSLQDVDEGSTVEVTGEPGAPGTVIARRVVIVG